MRCNNGLKVIYAPRASLDEAYRYYLTNKGGGQIKGKA